MFFTTKAEYGVRLLVTLGRSDDGAPISLKSIAESEDLPLAYLERIVALLRRAGLVESTRGAHGGYRLARAPQEITMDQALLALEGRIAAMDCFVEDDPELLPPGRIQCSHLLDHGQGCGTKLLWTRVQAGVIDSLRRTTLAELVAFGEPSTGATPGVERPLAVARP